MDRCHAGLRHPLRLLHAAASPSGSSSPARSCRRATSTFPDARQPALARHHAEDGAPTWTLFGDGKTAVKVTLNKYLEGMGLAGLASDPSPIQSIAADSSTNRAWTDANRNFVPDCDFCQPGRQRRVRRTAEPELRHARATARRSIRTCITGWGNRGVQLGVLDRRRSARSCRACRSTSATSAAGTATSSSPTTAR